MRKYWYKGTPFRNMYDVRYTDTVQGEFEARRNKWDSICREDAIRLCRQERHRRKYDSMASGYSPTVIRPMGWEDNGRDYELDNTGFIVLR